MNAISAPRAANRRSPPGETKAAVTSFCAAKLEGPGGFLWFDGNGKITAGNGTMRDPRPNAFSLLHIVDCPGSTSVCRASCYVHNLSQHAPETYALYRHNSAEIRRILASGQSAEWARLVGDWISRHCKGGFRWHVSGDVFSLEYSDWIAAVCRGSKGVEHWLYTRSFDFLASLYSVATVNDGNLAVNISADSANVAQARAAAHNYGFRVCYMSDSGEVPALSEGDVIFPDYCLRSDTDKGKEWFAGLPGRGKKMVCPVDYHGKSERRRCGPCDRCLL